MFKIILSLAGIQVLQAAVQILKMKFVALLLGPDGLGVISLINQFVQLVIQVSTLALPWVATRYMAVAFSHGKEDFEKQVKVFFRGIFYLSIFGMGVGSLLIYKYNSMLDPQLQSYQLLTIISLSMVMPMALKGFLLSVFTTAGKYRFSAITMLLNVITGTVAMLIGAYVAGLKGFFVAQAIAEYGILFYCGMKLGSELNISPLRGKTNVYKELCKLEGSFELIIYGCILYFLSPMALMVVRYSLLKKGNEHLVGLYQAVHGMVLYITVALGQATNLYLDPILKRDMPIKEKIGVANQYLRSISLILGSIMVFVVLFPELMLKMLYSSAFIAGSDFLYAFMVIESLNVISAVYLGMLVGQGWYRTHFILGIGVHSMVGFISYTQVEYFGIWGVVMALASGAIFTIILIYGRLFRECGAFIGVRQALLSGFIFLSVTISGYWVAAMNNTADWIPVQAQSRVALLFGYWLVIWLMLTAEEKKKIYSAIGGLKFRVFGK